MFFGTRGSPCSEISAGQEHQGAQVLSRRIRPASRLVATGNRSQAGQGSCARMRKLVGANVVRRPAQASPAVGDTVDAGFVILAIQCGSRLRSVFALCKLRRKGTLDKPLYR